MAKQKGRQAVAASPGSGVGAFLRKVREEKNLSVLQIGERLRIRPDYLRCIEEERFEDIPGELFVKGYLRAYASELGISPQTVVERFIREHVQEQPLPPAKPEKLVSTVLFAPRRRKNSWLTVAVAGVFLAASAWWFRGEVREEPLQAPRRTLTMPAASSPGKQTPTHGIPSSRIEAKRSGATPMTLAETATAAVDAVSAGISLLPQRSVQVAAREMAWFSVQIDRGNEKEFLLSPGQQVTLDGHLFLFRIGNAGGLDVSVDGHPIDRLKSEGSVVTLRIPEKNGEDQVAAPQHDPPD